LGELAVDGLGGGERGEGEDQQKEGGSHGGHGSPRSFARTPVGVRNSAKAGSFGR
jgi:hypothetical protein